MSDSGHSRQIRLTPWRIRAAVAVGVVLLAAMVTGFLALAGVLTPSAGDFSDERTALQERIQELEEELRKKDLALSMQQEKAEPEDPTLVASAPPQPDPAAVPEPPLTGEETPPSDAGDALTALSEEAASNPEPGEFSDDAGTQPSGRDPVRTPARAGGPPPEPQPRAVEQPREPAADERWLPRASFSATDLIARYAGSNRNEGFLSFLLKKDNPNYKFVGYLFVYVEMVDDTGKSTLYVYPRRTRLGDGKMPVDHTEGTPIDFFHNSQVEVEYKDARKDAVLSGVSILLYEEGGHIVYQRGFSASDVKRISAASAPAPREEPRRPERRRRAL